MGSKRGTWGKEQLQTLPPQLWKRGACSWSRSREESHAWSMSALVRVH